MTTCWIIVADAAKMNIYSAPKAKLLNGGVELKLVCEQEHPESREKNQDLVSDKVGSYKSNGAGSGYASRTEPKEIEFEKFAREISAYLDKHRLQDSFQELVVVAPPHIHGMLNKKLNQQVKNLVRVNVEKDYTHLKPKELHTHISNYL